jgi:hypothetical protein
VLSCISNNFLASFIASLLSFFGLSFITIEPIASPPRRMCFLLLGRSEWRLGSSLSGFSRKIAQERPVSAKWN